MAKKRSRDETASHDGARKIPRTDVNDPLSTLNSKYPETISHSHIPPFIPTQPSIPKQRTSLATAPPLPPLAPGYLSSAPFTHASTVDAKYSTNNHLSYERLEFLGDAYLEVIATRLVYSRFPQLLTGKQSQLRQTLVRNSTLAVFARQYNFAERIRISQFEAASEKAKEKIFGDVFEAYVAAIILSDPEGGFQTAEDWLTQLWAPMLLQIMGEGKMEKNVVEFDAKTQLASKVTTKEVRLEYREDKPMTLTKDSEQHHYMSVYLLKPGQPPLKIGSGTGTGKVEAGMHAALDAMKSSAAIVEEATAEKEFQKKEREKAAAAKIAAEAASEIGEGK